MSFRVRPATPEDFAPIYEMAKLTGGGFTNLPPDRATLVAKLARSEQSFARAPKPIDPKAANLFALVKRSGADLGQTISWQESGGVCDGNNIAACGVPVVDTMGVRGGKIHSMEEYLIVDSLKERAALSALTILRLAGEAA
jgi:acetylornithine deacetylase/succinyl-diaminopimelate desuccinylase-like protein